MSTAVAGNDRLDKVHRQIEQDYPALQHIGSDAFEQILGDRETVVFDVREPDEFAVSHIPGSIQVDPGIDPDDFLNRYGSSLADKDIVFYCSVGRRSSDLANRLTESLVGQGAGDIYNLENGVFGWHNQSRALVTRDAGDPVQTDYVHPYNWRWKRLLERREQTAYEPVIE